MNERRSFEFADPEDGWWHVQLSKLVAGLEALRDPESGLMGDTLSESFGWGVGKRYEFARTIGERSVSGAHAQRLWAEAIESIAASPKYEGLVLSPQMGLLPLGPDPDSGLYEFWHLATGERPVQDRQGHWRVTVDSGLVLVLIPGGSFTMGSSRGRSNEPPPHKVSVRPFLLSKYEMTQAQWLGVSGENPSHHPPGGRIVTTWTNPVESVTWGASNSLTTRVGLSLPDEAEWEYAARAGTTSPWWTGEEPASLETAANFTTRSDKWPYHAPVGSLRANGFGLHDTAGNVSEWVRDRYLDYETRQRSRSRVYRGGDWSSYAGGCRSARRDATAEGNLADTLGLRPARALEPLP